MQHYHIIQLLFKHRAPVFLIRLRDKLFQNLRRYAVLKKLRQHGFQFPDKTYLVQMTAEQLQFPFLSCRHLAQHHRLSHIIENGQALHRQLLKYPVGQTFKTDNVNIHNAMTGMQRYNIFLCLHGKLFRYDSKIAAVRIPCRLLYQIVVQTTGLAGA